MTEATAELARHGIESARPDAERLLRFLLAWDTATLVARGCDPVAPELASRYVMLVKERARRRPLQHVVGTQAFWRHDFHVDERVLIPRPETELAVEAALDRLRDVPHPVVVDVGTGSGCIAVSLAAERPDAEVHGVDLSEAALAVARANTVRIGAAVRFHHGDLLAPFTGMAGRVDLVVSNPPYVDAAEIDGLSPEVRDHEPRAALVPPSGDRLEVYRRLAPAAREVLKPGGWLILEIGRGMDREVAAACEAAGHEVVDVIPDLQSIPRIVVARYPDSPHSP